MVNEHTADLRNVREGDTVNLKTTEGVHLKEAECTEYQVEQADPRSGHIRESLIWVFQVGDEEYAAAILDGLASTAEEEGRFPSHNKLTKQDEDFTTVGYLSEVEILGPT